MSLWNTLVVSFLQNFWNKKKKIKNSNLHCLWNPLQSFQIPLNVLLIFHVLSWITFAIINKLQSAHLIFLILCGGFVSDLAFVNIFVLFFNLFNLAYCCLTFCKVLHRLLLVAGLGSLSELDWEGFKKIVSVLNQFGLEKDQIIRMSYNEIYLLLIFFVLSYHYFLRILHSVKWHNHRLLWFRLYIQ